MEEKFVELEKFIMEKMSENKMPGISIALVEDSEVVYSRGFGFRNLETGAPATPRTVYGIGSITKSFTALAIMQLVEKGLISLDDPVEKYIPIKLRPFGEPVRIHHLLTHSSGIPSLGYAEAFIDGILNIGHGWLPVATPEDVITFAQDAEKWAFTKPGERFFYSNSGYVMLGKIISEVSGMPYEEYVKENILKPLEMNRSYFFKEEVDKDPDVATGYVIDPQKEAHIPKSFPYGITADGGLLSNVLDLAKYLTMYINRGEYNGVKIVEKDSIESMETPYIKVPWEIFGGEGYGYGLIIHPDFLGERLIQHSGSVLIYTGFIGYIPEKKLGVAVLANSAGYPLSSIGMYALALMLGKNPEEDLPFIRRERILKKLEGTYEGYKGSIKFNVKRQGDFLLLEMASRFMNSTIPLVPERVEDNTVVCFTLSNGRKVSAEFYIKDKEVELIYERYKLVKQS
ncbi:serine hydrolase [Thermococcus aggregans]|uniref:Serine hydrolase n=1 Tax=Thermococcus aggregans TaxID=110163 RepID=A0A9E7MXF6_THEAG|nr:serine hydrolase [Thermococcus aggregans]USS40663.1 serine hydrolase [Thermococcus aggregans]